MNAPAEAVPARLSSDEKLWIVLSHLSILVGVGLLLPLIVYLVKRDDSPAVSYHAKEALNFHIAVICYGILFAMLIVVLIGIPLIILLGIGTFILAIVAAIKGSEGVNYRYPFTFRLIS